MNTSHAKEEKTPCQINVIHKWEEYESKMYDCVMNILP